MIVTPGALVFAAVSLGGLVGLVPVGAGAGPGAGGGPLGIAAGLPALQDDEARRYESRNYGYTIEYADPWSFNAEVVIQDPAGDPVDLLQLTGHSRSDFVLANFVGRRGAIEATACVSAIGRSLEGQTDPGGWIYTFDNVEPREDDDGDPLADGDEEDAFAVYDAELALPNGESFDAAIFLRCQRLDDEALLVTRITYSPADAVEDEEEAREELLDGVDLP